MSIPTAKAAGTTKSVRGRIRSTGKRIQITRRTFQPPEKPGRLEGSNSADWIKWRPRPVPRAASPSVNLLDLVPSTPRPRRPPGGQDPIRLSEKRRELLRPYLGGTPVRISPPMIVADWQRKLSSEGAVRVRTSDDGKPLPARGLSPNTVRLARAPLSGANEDGR